ncbi:hypothetical protein RI129_003414 [Pyrocoelia pectoralis]|uniref:Tudor domain-containing protein n=1 Tax=Pyrocoelia pectoralis TaxID=417401 RepID=A0AAN7VI03_9COLE
MHDGTYILDQVISDTSKLTDANTETPLKLRQPRSVTPVMKECDKSEKKLNRKLVIDQISDAGIFQFCEKTSDQTFTGFALPDAYGNEFEMLSEIGSNSTYDSKFIPNVGDVVGVEHDGDVARGLILSTTMGKYTCTLIDYGTTKVTHEVRQLPEKYTLIPEFSFECEANANIIQQLQETNSTIAMRIKTPSKLRLCLESGETYELIGRPIPFSPLKNEKVDTPQVITTPPRKVEECPIEKSPSNISKQKTVNEDKKSDETIFMPRKLVIEDLSERGTFDFIAKTSDTTFTCFICPEKYLAELNHLEMIYKDTSLDKSFKPQIGDLVAANSSDDGVVRAVVLNISDEKYECALIDYGTIQWISDVRLLPEKYVNIPEFVCECRADPEITKDLANLKCQSMTIKVPGTLTLTVENGKQHIVKGYRWDPTKLHVNSIKKDNQCKAYKRPASMLLKDTDKVMIVGTLNDYLLVRNKECHATFTAVCQELANYEGKPYEQPEVGCLAISNFKDENLYRVAINKIDGGIATLDYIDYGNIDSVPINGLKTINEKIATMNSTVINIHLKDFTQHKFSKKMLELLMNCNEKREKFNAHKISGEKDVYDLIGMDGVSLTERLNKVENNVTTPKLTMENKSATPQSQDKNYCTTPKSQGENKSVKFNLPETSTPKSHRVAEPVCRLKDILKCDMKPGNLALLCTHVGNLNEGQVSFCKADDETSMILVYIDEMISKFIEKDTSTSYIPTSSEVCLAKFDGDWFRAAVVKVDNFNKFGVYFVDYGNHCIVDSTDIRKLPAELSTTKAQAMVCRLDGVVKENGKTVTDALLSRLVVDIVESEIYTAEITSVCDNMYYIIIPSLLKQWKSDGLL